MADFTVEGIITVDASRAIRSLTSFQKKLQAVKKDLSAVDREIKKLDGKKIDVSVDANAKEITKLKEELNSITDEHVSIDVDTSAALTEAEQLAAEIKAVTEGNDPHVKILADTDQALADVLKLNAEVDALLNEKKTVKIDVDRSKLDAFNNSVAKGTELLGGASGLGMIGAIAALIAMIGPLGGVLTAAAAGMVGSFASMGTAVGAFVLFAIPTIKETASAVKLLATNTSALSPDKLKAYNQQVAQFKKSHPDIWKAAQGFLELKKNYMGFANELKPQILKQFGISLKIANALVKEMGPIALAAAPAVTGLFQDIKKAVTDADGPIVQFLGYIRRNAADFITIWGHTIGNFIAGISDMIVAFDPFTRMFNNGMLGMSKSFRDWAHNLANTKGFQDFVGWVQQNGPKVWKTLKDLGLAVVNILVDLAPLGMFLIGVIDGFANWYNQLHKTNPELTQMVTSGIALGLMLAPIAGYLSNMLKPLMGLVTPLLELVGAGSGIAGVVVAIAAIGVILAATHREGESFKKMMDSLNATWVTIVGVGKQVWGVLKTLWGILQDSGAAEQFQQAFTNISDMFRTMLPILTPIVAIIGGALVGALIGLAYGFNAVTGLMNQFVQGAAEVVGKVVEFFKWLYNVLVGHSIVPDLINAIVALFGGLPGLILGPLGNFLGNVISSFGDMVGNVVGSVGRMVGDLGGKFLDIIGKIRSIVGQAPGVAVGIFDAMKSQVVGSVGNLVSTVTTKFGEIISNARTKLGDVKSTVTGYFDGAIGWLKSAGADLIQGLINGITSKIGAVTSAIGSVAGAIKSHLPGSPIKEGPLKSWNNGGAGKRLMGTLSQGIDAGKPDVLNSISNVAGAIAGSSLPNLTASAAVAGSFNGVSAGSSAFATGLPGAGGAGAVIENHYDITVQAPVGSSSVEIGRTLVKHIDAYEKRGGGRRAS